MQFSSKPPFNDDPGAWVSEVTGSRYWEPPKYGHGRFRFDPRPEFNRPQTNPTNRILDITRRWKTRRGYTPLMAVLRMEDWTEQSQQFIESPTFTRDMETHALKVLRKWKAVYGEED